MTELESLAAEAVKDPLDDAPSPAQRKLFEHVQAIVEKQVPAEHRLMGTIAAYTYYLAVGQGANQYEALATVYHAGANHFEQAKTLAAAPGNERPC